MTPPPTAQPYHESVRKTLVRTVSIAVIVGGLIAFLSRAGVARWPLMTLLVLWPSLGGHFVEVWFLNWLRPRLPGTRVVQLAARLIVWLVAGIVLQFAMCITAELLYSTPARCPAWYIGGPAFIAIELFVHAMLLLRHKPNFYDGRG